MNIKMKVVLNKIVKTMKFQDNHVCVLRNLQMNNMKKTSMPLQKKLAFYLRINGFHQTKLPKEILLKILKFKVSNF